MFTLFLFLIILSGAALVAGLIAARASHGRVAESPDALTGQITMADRSAAAMRGTGVLVQLQAANDYAAMRRAVREHRWKDALPRLLVFHGFMGLLLFGALALLAATGERLVGVAAVAVAVYVIGSMAWNLSRP